MINSVTDPKNFMIQDGGRKPRFGNQHHWSRLRPENLLAYYEDCEERGTLPQECTPSWHWMNITAANKQIEARVEGSSCVGTKSYTLRKKCFS